MVGKHFFGKTFSIATAQALQAWIDYRIVNQGIGNFGLKIRDNGVSVSSLAETEITGLTVGEWYTINLSIKEAVSNQFYIGINSLANDNTSVITSSGWTGYEPFLMFKATTTTVYFVVGDNVACDGCYVIIDNISLLADNIEKISNGTIESNITGWYPHDDTSVLEHYEYAPIPPVGDNPYLEEVVIPVYNAGNSTHVIVGSGYEPLSDATFNNPSWKHFYVLPHNYGNQVISITTSGLENDRRTVSLHNGNDTHPAELGKDFNEVANYQLEFTDADYWVFDRFSSHEHPDRVVTTYRSSHNIFNRVYAKESAMIFMFRDGSNNNTIQNSRFDDQIDGGGDGTVTVQIHGMMYGAGAYSEVYNTKIINNEFYNQNDCIQIFRFTLDGGPEYFDASAAGTIIDSNMMYKDIPHMENAYDLKGGSLDSNNPVIISNNVTWGYFTHPDYEPDGYVPGRSPLIGHYNASNINIINNIFHDNDCSIAGGAGDSSSGFPRGFIGCNITGNVIYNQHTVNPNNTHKPIEINTHENTTVTNNYIISTPTGGLDDELMDTFSDYGGNDFTNSIIPVNPKTSTVEDWFYNKLVDKEGWTGSPWEWTASYEAQLYTAREMSDATFTDYSYMWDKFGGNPVMITLPKVLDPNGTIVSPV